METKINRFQVMALLQAARYYILTGDLEKAKSFGLNRAIFYAWAKRYGKFVPVERPARLKGEVMKVQHEGRMIVYVGNEGALTSSKGWFMIGGKEQLPEDYDRQVAQAINDVISYERAWEVAVKYVRSFSKSVLLDQQRFYEKVYKPVRDSFRELVKRYDKRKSLEDFF